MFSVKYKYNTVQKQTVDVEGPHMPRLIRSYIIYCPRLREGVRCEECQHTQIW